MNSFKNRFLAAFAILASFTVLLNACNADKKGTDTTAQKDKQENSIDTPTVVPVPVEKGKLSTSVAIPGELLPFQEVNLYAKVNSYVKSLLADVGSEVHEGQLLATLEAPEINSQLAGAQSRIKQQEALYFASKATYDRLLNTSKTPGTVSQNDLELAEAKKNSDFANVEAAKSSYKEAATNLNYLEIKAPFDGVITTRNVNLGAYVGPAGKSTDPLFVLQNQKKLRLVVSVPEANTGGVNTKTQVTFSVSAFPNQKFTAKVSRVAGALDEKLRSERLEMDVLNKDKKLLPHMFAEVNIPLPSQDSTLLVPKTAVVTSTERVFVIRITNNHAEWVDVKKGFQSADKIAIYGNLKKGDQVVKIASDEIRDGSVLRQ